MARGIKAKVVEKPPVSRTFVVTGAVDALLLPGGRQPLPAGEQVTEVLAIELGIDLDWLLREGILEETVRAIA